ncbi:MAG: nuclear transport factor 2 family protein [Verrucomicrobiales bacterium]|nr:nuclear transport factor 2 family protein [Verrucomicrobiales bacterium]
MSFESRTSPATVLAEALDAEDYDSARAILADDCRYEIRGEVIEGADAIIATYRDNGGKGRKSFDRVVYESSVSALSETRERIDYTDRITNEGEQLVHRCAQEVEVDPDTGLIGQIVHVDLPGEKEALDAFKKRHGW